MTDYKAEVHGAYAGGRPWSFGVHITSTQPLSTLATTWTAAVNGAWTDGTHGLQAIYHTDTVVADTTVATLNGTMHETTKQLTPLSLAGTSSDTTLPWEVALCVSLRSGLIQRHNRGRMFLPAFVEGAVTNNIISSTTCTRVRDAIAAMFAAVRADGSTIFVFNRKALVDLTPPFQKTVITSQLVSNKPARQSRRTKSIIPTYV